MESLTPETYESLCRKLQTYRARLRNQLMVDIFNAKNLRGTTLQEVGEYYAFDFVSGRFSVLVYNFIDRLTGSSMRKASAMARASELLSQSLLPHFPEGALSVTDDLLLCLINLEADDSLDRYTAVLDESFAQLLADELLQNFHCIMGAGLPCDDVFSLRQSYDSAVNATQYGIVRGYGKWYPAVDSVIPHLRSVPFSNQQLARLQTALSSRSETLLEEWVSDLFAQSAPLFAQDPAYAYLLPRNMAQRAYALCAGMTGAEILAHAGDLLESCVSLAQEQRAIIYIFQQFCAADRHEINPAVIIVQNYLQLHFHEPLTLEDLGRLTQLNAQYLSVMFRQQTGETISEYLRRLRLTTAQELLRTTAMSITQVADTVGYRDPQYFSRVFQKAFHQSPRQYRKGAP